MNTIFQRTNRTLEFGLSNILQIMSATLEFGLSNILQIMSASAISRHMSSTRGFFLEKEIRITFLYEKQLQQMTQFSKELTELYNSVSARLYKLSAQIHFLQPRTFRRAVFLKIAISITFLFEKQF